MKQRGRFGLSAEQKCEVWRRWKAMPLEVAGMAIPKFGFFKIDALACLVMLIAGLVRLFVALPVGVIGLNPSAGQDGVHRFEHRAVTTRSFYLKIAFASHVPQHLVQGGVHFLVRLRSRVAKRCRARGIRVTNH